MPKNAFHWRLSVATIAMLVGLACASPAPAAEGASIEELRNTVINLLHAMVQKGLLTNEQADSLVADARAKATADAQAQAAQGEAEKDAVHVAFVPQIVKDEIARQVTADLTPKVTGAVIAKAKSDQWGVPGALPAWVSSLKLYGDVRFRAEDDRYAEDNAVNVYRNFDAINQAGGIGKAGVNAILNTTENRPRLVGRMRFGAVADLGNNFKADLRLVTGTQRNPVSTNVTMGNYGGRWSVNVDHAAFMYDRISEHTRHEVDVRLGMFANPFVTTSELVWDNDYTFEGVSATYAYDLFAPYADHLDRGIYATVGAFPLQEVELSTNDKWLVAGQLGSNIPLGQQSRLSFGAAYYDFRHMSGIRNAPDSGLLDYTAPRFLQKGNTLFDIRNDNDPSTNLFALAGDYRLASGTLSLDTAVTQRNHIVLAGEYVKNIGWKDSDVFARTSAHVDGHVTGYDVSLSFGRTAMKAWRDWRAFVAFRSLQRDAVLDSFTDSDFHLGGTDAKGYQLGFDFGLSRKAWFRARYLSASEIDGPPLGIDVLQLDFNGSF